MTVSLGDPAEDAFWYGRLGRIFDMTSSAALVILAALAAAAGAQGTAATPSSDVAVSEQLGKLARRRILFGHQSVGRNILDGVERLAAAGSTLRVVEVAAPGPLAPAALSHALVGANGDPASKLDAFARLVDGAGAGAPDLALVKLCFVDVVAGTDTAALFEQYQAKLRALAARHPGTTFVHVTVPLTANQTGLKAWIKRLLGRQPYGVGENVKREEFNARMRAAYAGRAPLFDLARLEATSAAGAPVAFEWQGRSYPALSPDATDDGGHLLPAAQDRIARALVAYLASLP